MGNFKSGALIGIPFTSPNFDIGHLLVYFGISVLVVPVIVTLNICNHHLRQYFQSSISFNYIPFLMTEWLITLHFPYADSNGFDYGCKRKP